jgi:hypothetical protein
MSKVVSKLVKLAVVSSTLAVLGIAIPLPITYAAGGPIDLGEYCRTHGYQHYVLVEDEVECTNDDLTSEVVNFPLVVDASGICASHYPGSSYDKMHNQCVTLSEGNPIIQ